MDGTNRVGVQPIYLRQVDQCWAWLLETDTAAISSSQRLRIGRSSGGDLDSTGWDDTPNASGRPRLTHLRWDRTTVLHCSPLPDAR